MTSLVVGWLSRACTVAKRCILGRAAVGMGIPMGMGMGWVWGLKFNPHGSPRAAVGMGIPMGILMSMGMGWVWGLKFNPHGSPDPRPILTREH